MSKTPHFNAKIKPILDALTPSDRVCPVSGEIWTLTEEEIKWLKHFQVPPSDWSPTVRRKQLFGFNSGMSIWWNTHALTGKPLLSYVHPDNRIRVVPDSEWFTHDWGREVVRDADITNPFVPQVRELLFSVPMPAQRSFGESKNSIGISILSAEDSFMVYAGVKGAKRVAYGFTPTDCEDCQDVLWATSCRDSFGLVYCQRMFHCRVALQSRDCMDCDFVFDCRNCDHCFLSSNLRNKKYVFANEQLSQEEYERRMAQIDLTSFVTFGEWEGKFLDMLATRAIWPEHFNVQCEHSSGEYLLKCLHCTNGYSVSDVSGGYITQLGHSASERVAYVSGFVASSDVWCSTGTSSSSRVLFSSTSSRCRDVEYCFNCTDCENCFGCVGLQKAKYCILNKPYEETEYWKKVDEIKCAMLERGEYGSYFSGDFSLAGVEFASEVFFDLSASEKKAFGALSYDPSRGAVRGDAAVRAAIEPIAASQMPDCLAEGKTHTDRPLLDELLGRSFSVRGLDYEFYERLGLPLPRRHFTARLKRMARWANSFVRTDSRCSSCSKEIEIAVNTTFPERRVLCESCYLAFLEKHT